MFIKFNFEIFVARPISTPKGTPTSLITRKMQIKTSMKYHFKLIRMAIIKNRPEQNKTKTRKEQVLMRMWRGWNFCVLLVGLQNGVAAVGNSMEVP